MAITRNRSIAIVKKEINLKIKVGDVMKFSPSNYDLAYTVQLTPWVREKSGKIFIFLKVDQDFFDKHFRRFA